MPTKCTITGTVVAPDGLPVALAQIEFGSAKVRPMTPLTIAPESATTTTDEAGALTVELYPGEYSVRAMKTGRQRYPTFSITVPETASAVLADIIDLPPPVSLDAAGQAVLAAQAARDEAREAAGDAASEAVAAVVPAAIAAVGEELDGKVSAAQAAQEGAEAAAGAAAADAAASVGALLDDKVTAAEAARSGAAGSASTATAQAGLAGAARDGAVLARDASIINAQTYATEALGRAAVADGATFDVQGTGDVASYRYRRTNSTTSVLLASFPSAARVAAAYVKDQETAASGAYVEKFAFLDLTAQAVRNLTDAATPVRTVSKVADGLQIALSTSSRTFAFSTENRIDGGRKVRLRWRGVISTGTTGAAGIGFTDGVKTSLVQFQGNLGRASYRDASGSGGILINGIGPLSPTLTVAMEMVIDVAARTAALFLSINDGAPYSFQLSDIAIGKVELIQVNACTVVHSLQVSAIGDLMKDTLDLSAAPEITQIDRNTLNAAVSMLALMRRTRPSSSSYSIPNGYTFYHNAGKYFSSIDLRPVLNEADPDVLVLYVDIATGSDSGNNGSAEAPLKSLHAAMARAGVGGKTIIKAKGGLYPYANCFRGTASSKVIQIVSWDGLPVVSSMHDDTLSFALDTGTTHVATQAVGGVSSVFDAANLTADGDYGLVAPAGSLTACRATPGTWFKAGTSIYVNLFNGRAPDANLRVYTRIVGGASDLYGINLSTNGQVLYMEDVHLEGGDFPFATRAAINTQVITAFAKRCTFKYGLQNGLNQASAGLLVTQKCIAARNNQDGLNYKGSPFGGAGPLAVEIDNICRWNGRDAEGTNNGSTMHSGGSVIRVNGSYPNNQDRNVHDVGNCFSWNMGCTSGPSQSGKANFGIGIGAGDASEGWYDGCTSIGGAIDVEAEAGCTAYLSGFTGTGANIVRGTVTTYTP